MVFDGFFFKWLKSQIRETQLTTSFNLANFSSHDLFEGCSKLWLLLIFEHFVESKWLTWDALEHLISSFPYKGRDANSRPAILLARKMKIKKSRKVIGTFSEIENLIRSITQMLYDHIKDTDDEYWLWLLEIRRFVRFVNMPQITESQLEEMDIH